MICAQCGRERTPADYLVEMALTPATLPDLVCGTRTRRLWMGRITAPGQTTWIVETAPLHDLRDVMADCARWAHEQRVTLHVHWPDDGKERPGPEPLGKAVAA